MVYSLEERIEIIFIYGAQNQSAYRTAAEFRVRHPDKNLSHTHVNNIVAKFRETGSVKNKKREQPRILAENAQIEVNIFFYFELCTNFKHNALKLIRIILGTRPVCNFSFHFTSASI